MTAQEAVSGLCCQRYFELLLTLGGEKHKLFVQISFFKNKSPFGDLLIPSPPLVPMLILVASC